MTENNILRKVNNSTAITFTAVAGRLRSHLKLKLTLMVLLNLWVYLPYHFLQQRHFFEPIVMPASFCDVLIPFSDKAVWIYLSIYLLMPIGPFLMKSRNQILRYASGIALIGIFANFVFIFWPTLCARPGYDGTVAAYKMLTAIDNPFHAFPSLHAAFAVFSALCVGQVLRELRVHTLCRSGVWVWAFLILFATLATKQHMIVDILAGSLLAVAVYLCVFNRWKSGAKTKPSFQGIITETTHTKSTAL